MRVIDYHMHTHFSGDSEANPREHVLKAIEMNLDEICFTDHRDFDYPIDSFELDVENYYQEIQSLKEEFKDGILESRCFGIIDNCINFLILFFHSFHGVQ